MFDLGHKSLLARLLATENLNIIIDPAATTASFDLANRSMHLPAWIVPPVVIDLLIGHEASHALHTPPQGWHNAIEPKGKAYKTYLNVVEDARIEKMMCRKFLGLKRCFVEAYEHLNNTMNFFGVKSRKVDDLPLIDRLNLHAKLGALACIKFAPEELQYVSRLESLETWKQVVKLADDLYKLAQEPEDERDNKKSGNKPGSDGQPGGEAGEADADVDSQREGDNDPSGGSEDGDSVSQKTKKRAPAKPSKNQKAKSPASPQPVAPSITDEASHNATDNLKRNTSPLTTFHIPKNLNASGCVLTCDAIWLNYVKNHKMGTAYDAFYKEYKPCIDNYIAEFQRRKKAREYHRITTSKTGNLDPLKLHQYKLVDDIFLQHDEMQNSKNHGFIFLIDWSSSMSGEHKTCIKQVASLTSFCRIVGLPYVVYGFSDTSEAARARGYGGVIDYPISKSLTLLEIMSYHQTRTQHKRTIDYLLSGHRASAFGLGTTPLHDGLIALFDLIPRFQKKFKNEITNIITLTDGGHCGSNTFVPRYSHNHVLYIDDTTKAQRVASIKDSTLKGIDIEPTVASQMALVDMMKERFNCQVLNFYYGATAATLWQMGCAQGKVLDRAKTQLKDEHKAVITGPFFSKQFFIDPKEPPKQTGASSENKAERVLQEVLPMSGKIAKWLATEMMTIAA